MIILVASSDTSHFLSSGHETICTGMPGFPLQPHQCLPHVFQKQVCNKQCVYPYICIMDFFTKNLHIYENFSYLPKYIVQNQNRESELCWTNQNAVKCNALSICDLHFLWFKGSHRSLWIVTN